jgi:hypothetical protein
MSENKNDYLNDKYCDDRLEEVKKPYTQFSKKIITFCFVNLIIVEAFVMVMVVISSDTSVLPYFITSLMVTLLGAIVWYLKNSEAEKKARIDAEVERMKLQGRIPKEAFDKALSDISNKIESEPETYYKEDSNSYPEVNIVSPINTFNDTVG